MPHVDFEPFEALRPGMLRLARSLLGGSRVRVSPEDLVQEALARILYGLETGAIRGDAIDNASAYAYKVVKNLFRDELKAHRTRFEQSAESEVVEVNTPRGPLQEPPLLLRQILDRFDDNERCFLVRVMLEERSVTEAQHMCRWPPRSPYYHLKLLLARAREGS